MKNWIAVGKVIFLLFVMLLIVSNVGFAGEEEHGEEEGPVTLHWQALVAQIIGFLIVLWVMKRFLFSPVQKVLNQRRENVQVKLTKIEKDRLDMTGMKDDYEKKLAEIEAEARQKIQEAIARGNELGEHAKTEKHKEAEQMIQRAHEAIEREKVRTTIEMRVQITKIALDMTSRLIHKELDPELHKELIDKFIDEVEEKVAHHKVGA